MHTGVVFIQLQRVVVQLSVVLTLRVARIAGCEVNEASRDQSVRAPVAHVEPMAAVSSPDEDEQASLCAFREGTVVAAV